MNKLHFMAIIAILTLKIHSQSECATTTPSVDFLDTINPSVKVAPLNNATIKLYFHVVKRSNGTGNIGVSDVLQGFNALQYQFAGTNICFSFKGYEYINDDNLFKNFKTTAQQQSLISHNPQSDAIDVYIITKEGNSDGVDYPYLGYSFTIPSKTIIVCREGLTYGGTSFAHELGHSLGLLHTFDTYFCLENPNGSNSSICGDLITDTPADEDWDAQNIDPLTKIDANCNYVGGGGFNPLTNNMMSYYRPCRTQFTNGQSFRMRDMIANSSVLQQCLVPTTSLLINKSYPYSTSLNVNCQNIYFQPLYCPQLTYNELITVKGTITTFGSFVVNPYPPNNPFGHETSVGLISETEIELTDGFEAHQGAKFAAVIAPACPPNYSNRTSSQNSDYSLNDLFGSKNQEEEMKLFLSELNLNPTKSDILFQSINVIPNPSNGVFKLVLNENYERPSLITIIDNQGKTIYKIEETDSSEYNIDLTEFQSGLYVIKLSYPDNIVTFKIVKN